MAMAGLLFPSLEDSFSRAMALSVVATGIILASLELSGYHLGFSKFAAGLGSNELRVPSKLGMSVLYFPTTVVAGAVLAYWIGFLRALLPSVLKSCGETRVAVACRLQEAVADFDVRLLLVVVAVFVHFVKRELELRKDGSNKYVVPQGGLFGLFVCPHYIFEMVMFVGIALMSQTSVGFSTALLVFMYLSARTIQTKQWYMKKVDGFPRDRSVLVPGVF